MSKRKRSSTPEPDEPTDDASVKDDMVHVTSDMLSGSPDIFAGKKTESEPAAEPEPEPEEAPVEPIEASSTMAPAETTESESSTPAEDTSPTQVTAEPVATAPPYASAEAQPARQHRGGSTTAIGIVLVVIGIFALAVALTGIDLRDSGWPLFIIIPGLTLMIAGFVSLGSVATVPGGVVTMLGVVLAYANSTGDWPMWAYGWSLVIPFGLGLGVYLQALRDRDQGALRTGRTLLFVGIMIFLIGFVLFESILGISGRDAFGPLGKAALPLLLILVGVILLVRSMQRSRQA
jgi:hypothetical protein